MTFTKFEADSEGRVYGYTESGEILPLGVKIPSLASRSDITGQELKDAAHIEESMELRPADTAEERE